MKLADPGITAEPRGLTASQSRPADIFTTAAVPRRSAALDVCVASSVAAAACGEAAQAAFDRKLSHYRNEFGELRRVFSTVLFCGRRMDDRTGCHSDASVRSRHRSSRDGQQMSAKSHHRRWKREIQMVLLRRKAAMAPAVLPTPQARAE